MEIPTHEVPLWRRAYHTSDYPALKDKIEVDVVIVGGGITGLTTAYILKHSGLTVAVIEKDTIGGGTTGRTTGKVTSQHNVVYKDLIDRLGKKTAQIYGKSNQAALEQIERIIRLEKIDCDWQQDDAYVFTTKAKTVKALKAEAHAAASLGLPASFETESGLPFEIKGAVKFAKQGKFHSQKYLLALAEFVHGQGSFIFEKSNVMGIRDGRPCHVRTKHGSVTAKHTVVATNVPTFPLLARGEYCAFEYPTQSYIVAGVLEKPVKGMYISPDKEHHSILPIDLNGDHMLLIGGGGNLAGLRLSKQNKFKRLAKYGAKWFEMPDVRYAWSDRDYMGYDGIPLVGKLYPWSKATYVASAYGKWGLTNSMVAASIIRDYICEIENAWAHEFEPHRMRAVRSFPRAVWKQAKSQLKS